MCSRDYSYHVIVGTRQPTEIKYRHFALAYGVLVVAVSVVAYCWMHTRYAWDALRAGW